MSNKVKTGIFIAGFTAFTLAALYPVVVYPKLHPEVYSKYEYKVCKLSEMFHHSQNISFISVLIKAYSSYRFLYSPYIYYAFPYRRFIANFRS